MRRYFETCKVFASGVDLSELAAITPEPTAAEGSTITFRRLGELSLFHTSPRHLGLKIPIQKWSIANHRILTELALIDLIADDTPKFLDYIPAFMNLVKVEQSKAAAILTEDASGDGQKILKPIQTSLTLRSMLYEPFKAFGLESSVLNNERLDTVAFDIDGREQVLDLYTPPIEERVLSESTAFQSSLDEVGRTIDDITITLPFNSVLGQALHTSPVLVQ